MHVFVFSSKLKICPGPILGCMLGGSSGLYMFLLGVREPGDSWSSSIYLWSAHTMHQGVWKTFPFYCQTERLWRTLIVWTPWPVS